MTYEEIKRKHNLTDEKIGQMFGYKNKMSFSDGRSKAKTWKDIWGAGQGVGQIDSLLSVQEIVNQLRLEYQEGLRILNLRGSF